MSLGGSKSSSSSAGSFSSTPTFDDRGNDLISKLSQSVGQGNENSGFLGDFLKKFMMSQDGSGQGFTNEALSASRAASQQGLNQNLAAVRSQGNRGGFARDVMNQAGTVGQFEKDLNANETAARLGQFNADRGQNSSNTLSAASLLSGLSGQGQQTGTNLLSLLRGTSGTQEQSGRAKESNFSLNMGSLLAGLV